MPDDDPLDDPRWHDALRAHVAGPPDEAAWNRITGGRRRRGRVLVAVAAVLVVAAGLGAAVLARDDPPQAVDTVDTTASTTSTVPEEPTRFRVSVTVLESAEHGASLCLGAIATSYPPQCGNVPILDWDWDAVDGEERSNGTIWGDYTVTGTYDGETFTLTELPGPPRAEDAPADPFAGAEEDREKFASPCPAPPGGWGIVDAAKVSFETQQGAQAYAAAQPDFAVAWIDATTRDPAHPEVPDDPATTVLNFAFTGDLERHEAELRAIWGGPLCVSRKANRTADLERIQQEIGEDPSIDALGSGAGNMDNVVHLTVVYDDGSLQRRLDDEYGEGIVEVTSALRPVD